MVRDFDRRQSVVSGAADKILRVGDNTSRHLANFSILRHKYPSSTCIAESDPGVSQCCVYHNSMSMPQKELREMSGSLIKIRVFQLWGDQEKELERVSFLFREESPASS